MVNTNKRIITICASLIFLVSVISNFVNSNSIASTDKTDVPPQAKLKEETDLDEMTVRIASAVASLNNRDVTGQRSEKELRELVKERYQLLVNSIDKNPSEVLRVEFPANILSKMPADIASFLEKRLEIEGELEVINECDEKDSRLLYFIKSKGERLSVHFSKQPEENLLTGTNVKVKGVLIGDAMVVDEKEAHPDSGNLEVTEAALPNTFGEQKVLVLLVNFQNDQSQPFTVATAQNLVFTNVNNFYREASYQQTWLTGNVYGYFTLPMNSGDCSSGSQISYYAKRAAESSGINVSAYSRYIYVFPTMAGCSGYSGWATIGGNEAWINGSLTDRTVAHELGHNFGLYHARAMECGPEVFGANCSTIEMGNTIDMMGLSTAHFHSYQKERLGWLNYGSSPTTTSVQTSGNYFIAPYSTSGSSPKALKILKSPGVWYYLELRHPFGFDSVLRNNSNVMNGVLITMNKETNGQDNYLLDMTPETSSWYDPALTVNRNYTDSNANITITPLSVTDTGATVNIAFGGAPCVRANPTVLVSPSTTQWITAGASASYNVIVTNNNSSNCPASSFSLQTVVPSSWSYTVSSPILNLNSGSSATVALQITSPQLAENGFYNAEIYAVNANAQSYSALAPLNIAVNSSLAVLVSTSQPSYTLSQTIVASANVTANNAPVSGTSVTFNLKKPDNSIVTGTAISGTNGTTTFSYKLNRRRDPVGIYQVTANAVFNNVSGSGTISFVVR
jgi:hypothetical protein